MTDAADALRLGASPRRIKKASEKRREPAIAWPHVLRVLSDDADRLFVVARLKTSGFSADSFASQRQAREIVAYALAQLEDRLEDAAIDAGGAARGKRREQLTARRLATRDIRRRLEWELWP